jgi:hypothetical protein
MYVYGNGKWHEVERVVEQGQMKLYLSACGQHYPGECNTSDDQAVLDSRFFCSKCLTIHRKNAKVT